MKINEKLANKIAQRAMAIICHNVNVIDSSGVIIASGNPGRIGLIHDVAIEVIKKGKRIVINDDTDANQFKNTEPGINHPIVIDNEVVMVIGVSGNPAIISRYSELAILTAELLLTQASEINNTNWKSRIKDNLMNEFIDLGDSEQGLSALKKINELTNILHIEALPVVIRTNHDTTITADTFDSLLCKLASTIDSERILIINHNEILLLIPTELSTSLIIEETELALSGQISSFKMGIGINAISPINIRESILYARSAIEVASNININSRIYYFKEMIIPCLLKELEKSYLVSFFNQIAQKLLDHPNGRLLIETLEFFIKNNAEMNKTAIQLGVHRNTLAYRLTSISKITKLDPNKFLDRFQLTIAIDCHMRERAEQTSWIETIS